MRTKLLLFTTCLWLLFSAGTASAQQERPVLDSAAATAYKGGKFLYHEDLFAFADLRYGYSMIGHHFHAGANFKYQFNLFKIGFTHSDNFESVDTLRNRMNELAVMYGWSFRKNNFLCNIAFGVSGNWGTVTTNKTRVDSLEIFFNPLENAKGVGFPIELTFAFTPPPKLKVFSSIGVSFFGNFNSRKSYFGGGLNLMLGKVSPKLPPGAEKDPFREYHSPKQQRQRWAE
jgi:hypothetical protein